ncbi:MAG: hypothetical protein IJZ00_04565 [Lachnospiraceae bacterium]|nr:hypothetical protein [Lachnospiraceae bacterium]
MKKKKVIITSIIATLLLAGLLFYWNNNEVHACEAVSLEEAREILTEENVLLEYVCGGDSDERDELSQKNRGQIRNSVSLVLCRDGSVYYCSFYPVPDVISRFQDELWEAVQFDNMKVYYLGKLSTADMMRSRMGVMFYDEENDWKIRYRNTLDVEEPQSDMIEVGGNAQRIAMEEIYFPWIQNQEESVAHFESVTHFSCYIYRDINDKIIEQRIAYEYSDEKGYSLDSNALMLIEIIYESWFFETYAGMAETEIYTRGLPVIADETHFVYEGTVDSENIVLQSVNEGNRLTLDEEGNLFYIRDGYLEASTMEAFQRGEPSSVTLGVEARNVLTMNGQMIYIYSINHMKEKIYLHEEIPQLLWENSGMGVIKEYDDSLYYSDYSSLVRLDSLGTAEILWEHAVYAFTVDENYIYIFDGNTWQVLDRETGEDLGYIATDVYFAYEMDELYAAGGRLYFAAWNRENNTISCNSLDMEGNLTQIGEVHSGTEADSYRVAAHEEYLFYSIEQGESLVRVNINTGEETIVQMDEYGVVYAGDLIMADDSLVVYWRDEERRDFYSFLNVESMELEAEVCLE